MIQVDINSTDRTESIVANSLQVSTTVTNQVSNATFSIRKYGTKTLTPAVDDEVEIYDGATKIFNGIIMNWTESLEAPGAIMYNIQCVSSSWKLDSVLAARAYQNKTVQTIMQELIAEFAPDFTTNNVEGEFEIKQIVFNNIPVAEAISRLARIVSYEWYVDVDNDVHFVPRYSEVAPYNLTDTSGNYAYRGLIRKLDGTQIVNKVIVRGGEFDGDTFTDEITVSGSDTLSFNLPYKFSNFTVELNTGAGFVAQTVGVDFIDTFDDFDVLYNFQSQSFRWETARGAGDIIKFSGNPKYPVFGLAGSASSIARYGQREKLIRDRSIEDNGTARRRAIAELQTYADEIQDATFFTYTTGLQAGMFINLTSTERDCDVDFVIKKLTYEMVDPNTFGYKVDCVTTEKYELTDLLRFILEEDPTPGDQSEIAELTELTGDSLEIAEVINNVAGEADNATISIDETIQNDPLGAGVEPVWVWGYSMPSSITDTNRMLFWSGASPNGGVWQAGIDYFALLESGDFLLLETADKIIL